MPSQQQLVLEPLGLVTEPNKLGQIPAGALSVMTDCVERSPGVIENIKSWQTKVTVDGANSSTTTMFAIPMDGNRVVVIYDQSISPLWRYRWYDMSTGAALYPEQSLTFSSDAHTYFQSITTGSQPHFNAVRVGTQTFLNAFSTVLVWDDPTAATLASSLVRAAGLQRPALERVVNVGGSAGTALPVNAYAHYVAVNTRTINGRKVVSAPSAAVSSWNRYGTVISTRADFRLRTGDQQAGDTIELYRTPSKPSGITNAFQQFQAGEEAGAEYRRVASKTLTAADISAVFISIFDDCPDTSLGEALYTNQAINGSGSAAEAPPAVQTLLPFKGFLFGLAPVRAPSITLRPVGIWGGFDAAQSIETIRTGFGVVFADGSTLTGASFSSGATTINVSPTSQLQYLAIGQQAISMTSKFNGIITAIGASSFTIDTPTTGSSGSDAFFSQDLLWWDGFGALNSSWQAAAANVASAGSGSNLALRAQSLKLAPYTPSVLVAQSNVGFTAQPTDGVDFYHRFLQDSRPQLQLSSSKNTSWDPPLVNSTSGTTTNVSESSLPRAFVWSEQDQPEAWPLVNEDTFSRGSICAGASTADHLVLFYTDAIWGLSGTGGSAAKGYDWRADPIATGITPIGSQCVCVLLDTVYAMTSEGLIALNGGTIRNITQGRVHDQLDTPPWTDGPFTLSTAAFVVEDEEHDEILMREPSATGGKMWIYNTHTDRLSQTTSHAEPMSAFYSRALRSPVVVGRDGGGASPVWTLKAQTGAYGNFALTYAKVYADNPFAQRHWQTLNVSAETAGATVATTFNGVAGPSRTLDADGRAGFEVPIDAPAIGNTMQVGLTITTSARTKLHGFALDYRDHTERRKTR